MTFAKLIDECESLARVHGTETEDEYKRAFVDASFNALKDHVAKALANANLGKEHFLRFQLQVHAQEVCDKPQTDG